MKVEVCESDEKFMEFVRVGDLFGYSDLESIYMMIQVYEINTKNFGPKELISRIFEAVKSVF